MYENIVEGLKFIEGGSVYCINGATGFIGSSIIRFLLWMNENQLIKKNKIIAVTRSREKAEKLFAKEAGYNNLIIYQSKDNQELRIKEKVDFIIHTAGPAAKHLFYEMPVETCDDTYLQTSTILKWSKKYNIKSFIYLSSVQVYGNLNTDGCEISETLFGSLDSMNSDAVYAESKRMSEMLCSAYFREYALPVKVVRLYSVYGSGMSLKSGTFLADFLTDICKKRDIIVKGSGMEIRNLCHIEDVISGIFYILHKGVNGEAYNLGSEINNLSILKIAQILKGDGMVDPFHGQELREENHIFGQMPDLSKIKNLGWAEKCCGFEKNVNRIVEDILKGEVDFDTV